MDQITIETYKINDSITTPNGPGVVWGRMFDQGRQYYLVHHQVSDLKPEPRIGRCLFPRGKKETTYAYDVRELQTNH